jgi:hypothetical protein
VKTAKENLMHLRQYVLDVFNINRLYGEQLLSATPAEQFCQVPHPGMNHPAWIAGHITITHRRVGKELGAELEIPDGWPELFGKGSRPQPDAALYPAKEELVRAFLEGHEKLAAAFAVVTPEQLAAPNVKWRPSRMETIGAMTMHIMTTHEALHLGQLSAWRRAMGMPTIDATAK